MRAAEPQSSPELGSFPKALKLLCQLLRPWSPPGKTALSDVWKEMDVQNTRTFSKWARSPATGLSVGTRSGAPGGQLHLALGLSFVEAASPTSPLLPPPPLPGPRWAVPTPDSHSLLPLLPWIWRLQGHRQTAFWKSPSLIAHPYPHLLKQPPPETLLL